MFPLFVLPDLHKRACSHKFPFTQCFLCQSISANIPLFFIKESKTINQIWPFQTARKRGAFSQSFTWGWGSCWIFPLMHKPLKTPKGNRLVNHRVQCHYPTFSWAMISNAGGLTRSQVYFTNAVSHETIWQPNAVLQSKLPVLGQPFLNPDPFKPQRTSRDPFFLIWLGWREGWVTQLHIPFLFTMKCDCLTSVHFLFLESDQFKTPNNIPRS